MARLTLGNAPRAEKLLAEMGKEDREYLYEQLAELLELAPNEEFSEQPAHTQAEVLEELLEEFDDDYEGYASKSVALPIRTEDAAKNHAEFLEFSSEVAELLNGMRDLGYESLQALRFESHGIMVVGYKPPMPAAGQAQIGMPMMPMFQQAGTMARRVPFANKHVMALIKATALSNVLTPADADALVSAELRSLPIEAGKEVLQGLKDHMKQHEEESHPNGDGAGCTVSTELQMLIDAVDKFLTRQVS